MKMIAWFNHITDWVTTEICSVQNDRQRTIMLTRFVEIGKVMFVNQIICRSTASKRISYMLNSKVENLQK